MGRSAFAAASAIAITVVEAASPSCTLFTNNYNTEYTIDIEVGTPGQKMRVVPDSGSNDLLLDSTYCSDCGGHHNVYDAEKSTTFAGITGEKYLSYGQGMVDCEVTDDVVKCGTSSAQSVPLMLMTLNALDGFDQSPYDGVMGFGRQQLDDDNEATALKAMGYDEFAICFGNEDGAKGRLQLGGAITDGAVTSMPAEGVNYWGLYMTSLKVDGEEMASNTCSPHCAAIVDSGTSLITLPENLLDSVMYKIGDVEPDCSNVDELPEISFELGGHTFTMDASHYVVKTLYDTHAGSNASMRLDRVRAAGLGLEHWMAAQKGYSSICQLAFMSMDEDTDGGPMVILGMPFQRQYAATFSREGGGNIKLSTVTHEGTCTTCSGHAGGDADSDEASSNADIALQPQNPLGKKKPHSHKAPVLPLSRLRLPFWAKARTNSTKQSKKVRGAPHRNKKGEIIF
jgi:hypothetical protein